MKHKIRFIPEDNETIAQFLESIKNFGKLEQNNFEKINNPWTYERFRNSNIFYYTLKEDNYIAEKTENNDYIHLIKSKYQLKNVKIYKIEFNTNYTGGDYGIWFSDFSKSKS